MARNKKAVPAALASVGILAPVVVDRNVLVTELNNVTYTAVSGIRDGKLEYAGKAASFDSIVLAHLVALKASCGTDMALYLGVLFQSLGPAKHVKGQTGEAVAMLKAKFGDDATIGVQCARMRKVAYGMSDPTFAMADGDGKPLSLQELYASLTPAGKKKGAAESNKADITPRAMKRTIRKWIDAGVLGEAMEVMAEALRKNAALMELAPDVTDIATDVKEIEAEQVTDEAASA